MNNTTTNRPAETITCELCGRKLDRNLAKEVPVIGYVGSTCFSRVSAVAEVLTQNGLGFLVDGPIRITPDMMETGAVRVPGNFEQRAYRLGLSVTVTTEHDNDGNAIAHTLTPTVRAGKRLRRVLTA